jgi:iron complex outermembrane receptor protein
LLHFPTGRLAALTAISLACATATTRAAVESAPPATATAPDARVPSTPPADPANLPGPPAVDGASAAAPFSARGPNGDLTSLSLEDLMNVEVTSVSKQKQRVGDAPAAISVITQDDIRRSGLTSIPELLRMVPGVEVQQLNAHVWEIGARGFVDVFSNKLLVLQDGRTLYNKAFGGVFWDMQDYLLPDLDRIEVIRGPGGTLWGSNAVNGVINITTKSARDTQGLLLNGDWSNQEYIGGVRYGGKVDDQTYYRVYGKYRNADDFKAAGGFDSNDAWEAAQGGFRIDRYATPADVLTLQGDLSRQYGSGQTHLPTLTVPAYSVETGAPYNSGGGNLLGRWTHTVSTDSEFSVQTYFDRLDRHEVYGNYEQSTFDIEGQHRYRLNDRNELIYGVGLRYLDYANAPTPYVSLSPNKRDDYEMNAFVQDDVTIVRDRFHVILGAKAENNSYDGWNFQPSGRLLWTPDERNTLWAAVSRGVRTPDYFDQYGRVYYQTVPTPAGVPGEVQIKGDPRATAETLLAYELGYRVQATPTLAIDLTGFVNTYDNLRSYDAGTPQFLATPTPHLIVPAGAHDRLYGESYGFEVAGRWNATDRLHLTASYSLVSIAIHTRPGGDASNVIDIEQGTPRNQAQVHVRYDVTPKLEANAAAYYVEETEPRGAVPSYVRVDLGLTYHPTANADFSIGVQNLLDDRHPEAGRGIFATASEIPRTLYAQFTLRY